MNVKDFNSFSDEQIVAGILANGQTSLFSILFKRYHNKVLDKCYSMLKNRKLAEEFASDVLSKAYEKLATYRNISAFSSWLYSLTYNHCIDYLRMSKKLHYPEYDRKNRIPEIIDESSEELEEITYENFLQILEMI
ncbi:MAG: RNA polymerase sigma factor, partial [Bacteroidales bacterium]|nr:RNA polymerase sigma factor [Bacteroidales bacterium]